MNYKKTQGSISATIAILLVGLSFFQPMVYEGYEPFYFFDYISISLKITLLFLLICSLFQYKKFYQLVGYLLITFVVAILLLIFTYANHKIATGYWLSILAFSFIVLNSIQKLALFEQKDISATWVSLLTFIWVLYYWQLLTFLFNIPQIILPAPSEILISILDNRVNLLGDVVQTVFKSTLIGYLIGSIFGFLIAILIDRFSFFKKGLLPLANFTSVIPLVGVAPIAVMWFGFDWQSKAAVVVLVSFFPILVKTLAGLDATSKLQQELMYSYSATKINLLFYLRLQTALPFIFNALKVNSTLALITAIVSEFFGSTTSGIGFRISTEAARLHMPAVWSSVVIASIIGSFIYFLLTKLEYRMTFWHPSMREA